MTGRACSATSASSACGIGSITVEIPSVCGWPAGCADRHRRALCLFAVTVVAGPAAQQGAPGAFNGRDDRVIEVAGHIVFGDRHERIGQLQWRHTVSVGRLHNVDEGLIEAAMAQRYNNALSGAEASLAAEARVSRAIGL